MTDREMPAGGAVTCPRCERRGKTWEGDEPKCAFDAEGVFLWNNWNCATMNDLRDLAGEGTWSEDQYCAIIPDVGRFIVLSWYKHRGRTEGFWIIDGPQIHPGTLDDTDGILNDQRPT